MQSISAWIERKLKLRINRLKSAAAYCAKRKFLGYTLHEKFLSVAPESWSRLRQKLLRLTRRHSATSFPDRIESINQLTRGWLNYFKLASCKTRLQSLDEWLRHRLRSAKLKELKRAYPRVKFVRSLGVSEVEAWKTFKSGKGLWRLSKTPVASIAMNRKWFDELGLQSFSQLYLEVKC